MTPLLLLAEKKLRSEVAQRPGSGLTTLANTVWGAVVVAAISMLALVNWSLLELALPIIPGGALLFVYFGLIPRAASGHRSFPLIPEVQKAIRPLSIRIIVLLLGVLGVQVWAFGMQSIELGWTVLLLGFLKAGFWCFSIQTVSSPFPLSRSYDTDLHAGNSHLMACRYFDRDVWFGS